MDLWGKDGTKISIMGHEWDIIAHMNFAEIYMHEISNELIIQKKTHALGRSLMIFKMPASRN